MRPLTAFLLRSDAPALRRAAASLGTLLLVIALGICSLHGEAVFDWPQAQALHAREARGESLNEAERKLLDEAKQRFAAGERPPGASGAERAQMPAGPAPRVAEHYTPLPELKAPYHGQDGGLYGGGENEPPAAHAALAAKAVALIRPLDAEGRPSPAGKIVLLSIGMSNTTMEFSAFVPKANGTPAKAPEVAVVDGAQGGKDATAWSQAAAMPWQVAEQRLRAAQVSPRQVQAVWIKQALIRPQESFPVEAERLRDRLREIVLLAHEKYPALQVAYLSSRIYAGYARTALNPEPHAYESAFAVRWLIDEQINGGPALNANPANGSVKAPVLLWGPYLWADGDTPRAQDGLVYLPQDFAGDGTHPSSSGREKVAKLLLDFFTTDPRAKRWFAKGASAPPVAR